MTKKLFALLLSLTLILSLTAALTFESSAAGEIVNIYETATDPVIDGVIDKDVYTLVCTSTNDPTKNFIANEGCTVDDYAEVYACWKGDFLYLATKITCTEPHVAYMDNATEHYIFNAHYQMTSICPGDPYQSIYTGDNEDGTWSWAALDTAKHCWEWTVINPSQETTSDVADHFRNMSEQEGFEYKVVTDGGFDVYEQKIPLSKVINKEVPNGIKAQVGSMFGLGFQCGLTDFGTGYTTSAYQDYVYFSDYFGGDKNINGMAYCKLASTLVKDPGTSVEPAAPEAITSAYDIFPAVDGTWALTPVNDTNVSISYSQGKTVIGGSVDGTYPSASANLPATIYLDEGDALVYDLAFETGTFSIRFNDSDGATKALHQLFKDAVIEDGSGDLKPGTYKGYVTYEQLAEQLGADENGLVAISKITIFSCHGSEVTVNAFKFENDYEAPVVPDDSSDPEVESADPVESQPEEEDDKSEAPATSADASAEESKPEEKKGCGSSIAATAVVVASVLGLAVGFTRKKK